MGASRIYLSLFTFLFALSSFGALWAQEESSRHQAWLVTDTLDLPLADPSYEVGFFRDEIIFLTPAFEGLGRVPMDDPKLANRQPLIGGDVFPFSPASVSFSMDYAMCYAAGQKEVWDDFRLEKIFTLSLEQGYSSRLQALSFTFDSCRYLHPALAANDSMLIFSSDRLPTSGGLDLFVSRLDSTGWSLPESLGSSINSAGHDRYPYLDKENNLWFASTGHKGYGAYDLYVCLYNGQGWEGPQNLGPSINTNYDEIGFSMHEGAQVVLFTRKSLREGMALRLVNKDKADYTISLVLLNQANPPTEPQEEIIPEPDPDPVSEPQLSLPEEAEESAQLSVKDPERLLFRVQILSSNQVGSTPHVFISGKQYTTYEYHFKGSYRITVGEFEMLEDANKFRLQCKQAGYNQAFVAAFRGNKRETDPSVFKK